MSSISKASRSSSPTPAAPKPEAPAAPAAAPSLDVDLFKPVDTAQAKADVTAAVVRATPSALTSIDTSQALSGIAPAIDSGTLHLELPLAEAKYKGVKVPPGTRALVDLAVAGGNVVADQTRVRFEPPLDGPAWVAVNGAGLKEKKNGIEAAFTADLKGMFDLRGGKTPLGVQELVAGFTAPAEPDTSKKKKKKPMPEFVGPEQLAAATLSGQVSLEPGAAVKLGAMTGTVENAGAFELSAKAGVARLTGPLSLSKLDLGTVAAGELSGELHDVRGQLELEAQLDPATGGYTTTSKLTQLEGQAPLGFGLEKHDGSARLHVGSAELSNASVVMTDTAFDFSGDVKGELMDGRLVLPASLGGGTATLAGGTLDGPLKLGSDGVSMEVKETSLGLRGMHSENGTAVIDVPSARFMGDVKLTPEALEATGMGKATVAYRAAPGTAPLQRVTVPRLELEGQGTFVSDASGITLDSKDGVNVSGQLERLEAGRSADESLVLSQLQLEDGKLKHLAMTAEGLELDARGTLSGPVELSTAALSATGQLAAKNTRLQLQADRALTLDGPMRVTGDVSGEVAGQRGVRLNGTLSPAKVAVDAAGHVKVWDADLSGDVRVGKTSGIPAPQKSGPASPYGVPSVSTVRSSSASKLAGLLETKPPLVTTAQSLEDLAGRVESGELKLNLPFSSNVGPVMMAGRSVELTLAVRNGQIDEQRTRARIVPPPPGGVPPTLVVQGGTLYLRPDVNVSVAGVDLIPKIPLLTVGSELGPLVRRFAPSGQGGAGAAPAFIDSANVTVSSGQNVKFSAGEVRTFAGPLQLGAGTELAFSGKPLAGELALSGTAALDGAQLVTPDALVQGVRGTTDVNLTVQNGKGTLALSALDVTLESGGQVLVKTDGDFVKLQPNTTGVSGLKNGSLTLTATTAGAEPTLVSFSGELEGQARGRFTSNGATLELGPSLLEPDPKTFAPSHVSYGQAGLEAQLFVPAGQVKVKDLEVKGSGTIDLLSLSGCGTFGMTAEGGLSLDADAYSVDFHGSNLQAFGSRADALSAQGQGHVRFENGELELSKLRARGAAEGVDAGR